MKALLILALTLGPGMLFAAVASQQIESRLVAALAIGGAVVLAIVCWSIAGRIAF
jgi:hypothetical protein